MTTTIAAVIPTRNRPELACDAIDSLVRQDPSIEIFVSDNCSVPASSLRAKAEAHDVQYLRPPHEMSMTEHWDWALRTAMDRSTASHFTIHYDRKYSLPGRWRGLAQRVASSPDQLITYASDAIAEDPPPLRLWQAAWTGRLFSVQSRRVAELVASARIAEAGHALPVLSNCVVPRGILERMIATFGSICVSTTADNCFASRFLALEEAFLHLDESIAVIRAPHRSSGMGFQRGFGGDFKDWRDTLGDGPWLDASPVPGIELGQNMFFHEYELVRRATGNRLPPLDVPRVLEHLGAELRWVRDPQKRAMLRQRLELAGWRGEVVELPRRPRAAALRQALVSWAVRRFGFRPGSVSGFAFDSDEEALQWALQFPRASQTNVHHLALVRARETHRP
jgi:hypothetical protein